MKLFFVLLIFLQLIVVSCEEGGESPLASDTTTGDQNEASDSDDDASEDDDDDDAGYGVIFVSSAQNHDYSGLGFWDNLCNSEKTGHGFEETFYAVIADGDNRVPCTTANCSGGAGENLNWVLQADLEYRQLDETTVIGTTNSAGIFTFPLTNPISDDGFTVMTGFSDDWTNSDADCDNYEGITPAATAGVDNSSTETAVDNSTVWCNSAQRVYCAGYVPPPPPPQESYRVIFMTASDYQGGSGFLMANGISDFDNICASEATAKGLTVETYRAFIVGENSNHAAWNRKACSSANCSGGVGENLNWILDPDMEYRREDKTTVIGTTNSESIFDFPLDNGFTGTADEYWTGQTNTWGYFDGSAKNCLDFTIKTTGGRGIVGIGNATDVTSIFVDGTGARCNTSKKILCVEQTRD